MGTSLCNVPNTASEVPYATLKWGETPAKRMLPSSSRGSRMDRMFSNVP
jgi:hypothetical protein